MHAYARPLLALALLAASGTAHAASLHALTADGKLLMIDSAQRRVGASVAVGTGAGRVLAIALRPADGKLYGVTDAGQVVTIDPRTGRVTPGAKLDKPLEAGGRIAINFNPVVDRLRVIGANGANYRIHPDTGAVTIDGAAKYAPGSTYAATPPRITAAAYTNHVAGTKETALYTVDSILGQINLQAPPNDGVQQPKKEFGMGLPNGIGFDILANGQGGNTGYMLMDGKLFTVAVADLAVTEVGTVEQMPATEIVSLAVAK